ncbi:hypothetical protein HYFRA_00003782 [Hymenoscyphus fraxineus]|uniref:Uncharacterized protein n=1 Tax=Hymenoscyphus fraxineus TaxID=746836 RepID=A0A9N9KYX4_9HELO|nr:hypothetical protein HYFRA_00003782 [Hymenoscyphus fraxineus]
MTRNQAPIPICQVVYLVVAPLPSHIVSANTLTVDDNEVNPVAETQNSFEWEPRHPFTRYTQDDVAEEDELELDAPYDEFLVDSQK